MKSRGNDRQLLLTEITLHLLTLIQNGPENLKLTKNNGMNFKDIHMFPPWKTLLSKTQAYNEICNMGRQTIKSHHLWAKEKLIIIQST